MMKKITYLLILFLFRNVCCYAQPLKNSIQSTRNLKNDTSQVWQLYSLAWAKMYSKPDSSVIFSKQGILLSKKLHFKKGELACIDALAEAYNETGYYQKSLHLASEELKLAEDMNNRHQICAALMGIASAYAFEHKPLLAIRYFNKAKTLATSNNYKESLIAITNNLSEEFEEINRLDSAMDYAHECLRLSTTENNIDFTGCAFTNIGTINMKMKRYSSGMDYFRKALPYFKKTDDHEYLCRCYVEMAAFFQQSKQMDSALCYGNLCMQMALSSHIAEWTIKGSKFLMNYYKAMHNTDSASAYQSIYFSANKGVPLKN